MVENVLNLFLKRIRPRRLCVCLQQFISSFTGLKVTSSPSSTAYLLGFGIKWTTWWFYYCSTNNFGNQTADYIRSWYNNKIFIFKTSHDGTTYRITRGWNLFFLAKLEIKCNGLHISDDAAFIPVWNTTTGTSSCE